MNCEPTTHTAVIRIMGHDRLLYGSDFPASHFLGRFVQVGDSFILLGGSHPAWDASFSEVQPLLVGTGHLRALKWACWSLQLSDAQVEDIFWNNAVRVLGMNI